METWKPVPGWESSYEVSDLGRVRSLPRRVASSYGSTSWNRGRVLAQSKVCGYPGVSLGRGKRANVHRLVAAAFLGPCPDGMLVRHLDGDRANSVVSNLAYGTHRENEADKYRHGRAVLGERSPNAKLSADGVREMRRARAAGATLGDLSARFGVCQNNVSLIVRGLAWKHVGATP